MNQQFDQACALAQNLMMARRTKEAVDILHDLACQFPEQPMPFYMLGMMAVEENQDHLAIGLLQYALTLKNNDPWIWGNLGSVMKRQEHRERAMQCYRNALQLEKDNIQALTGLAGAYVNQGNPAPGISYARDALKQDGPHKVHARNALALLLLESGDWAQGFQEYRRRSEVPGFHVRDYGAVPRWDGTSKVGTLALHPEQGLGDEILFASCIEDVRPYAERIVGECNDRLLTLFRRSFPDVTWYGSHEELTASGEKIDAWERLGDLPGWFRKSPVDCPGVPYMRADYPRVLGYRKRLEAMGDGPYIGFAWLGGTASTHRVDRRAPRDHWRDLISGLPGIKISLQYGEDGEKQAGGLGLKHWAGVVSDMEETAALVMALDYVVSSPQTVIHMAGALGKKCLVAMSSKPAWRYQVSGPMPWYKSVDLIRQTDDSWDSVFFRIGEKLHADLRKL